MNKRDLLADLEAIREGVTLFGDPNKERIDVRETV